MTKPIRPSVWRRARRNTALSVSAVRIASGEYQGCPPGAAAFLLLRALAVLERQVAWAALENGACLDAAALAGRSVLRAHPEINARTVGLVGCRV